ncbi:efflux RND transporter permease subunit [uncultured Hymenobacter sp.]|uniref:efflux RND transporter permease subunit n=1 Tax=uncultured Hymenobacter sp. TaxID=170016 RepID=UPI0035CB1EBC
MLRLFIDRPVLSTVISILLVILGVLGLRALPVSQYPDIAPPTVQVSATYTGANADVVLRSVVVPLEEQINGVENMTYLSSTANNTGQATITIFFKQGTNPDLAAVNVQNRVSRAAPLLPIEVTQTGVVVAKRQSSQLLIFALYSDNPTYDQTFLQNYALLNLIPQIQRITGVGEASAFGARNYAMRIWLQPAAMANYGLIPADVTAALAQQNIEAAPGQFGENSPQPFQYIIKYKGRLVQPAEYGNIVLRTTAAGQVLRLKDIARIELGALTYSSATTSQGKPAAIIAIYQTAGSNAQAVVNDSKKLLDQAAAAFPAGIHYATLVDANEFLNASIAKVVSTLVIAFVLVFIVVFVFLQDVRSTLIPAIAVPVAIVGTFFFLNLLGFTLNLLTLFALVLAIGIVVDDAIVVVEAVHAKLDAGATSARDATVEAMSEISGVIIAITLVMSAVFVPVAFITGSAGVFYKQFGLTLAIAVLISAVNALTLSPALCALLLKPKPQPAAGPAQPIADPATPAKAGVAAVPAHLNLLQRFYAAFNRGFEAVTKRFEQAVGWLSRYAWVALLLIVGFGGGLWWLLSTARSGFVPNEDQGIVFADISLPPAASLARTQQVVHQVDSIAQRLPEMSVHALVTGQSFLNGTGSSYGIVIMKLKPWDQRTKQPIAATIGQLFARTAGIRDAKIIFFSPPTLQGFGNSNGFEVQVQDRAGGDIAELGRVSQQFIAALSARPEILFASTGFNPNFPQYEVAINVARTQQAGLNSRDILATLQGYFGGLYASNFNEFGKQYRVLVQAEAAARTNPESLNGVFVRATDGTMAPITEFVTLTRVFGPETLSRFNLYSAATVTGSPKPGFSSGDAITAIEAVAKQTLPASYGYEFSGLTREEIAAGSQVLYIFGLCLVFVYFLLSALYESYLVPFAVLLPLPIGLAGALLFARLFGIDDTIYLQIALIMLIGLLSKNAILIVEFARDRRLAGLGIPEAAVAGARARLRPILMTSFAFILGLLPLMFATGAGAVGNRSIGTVAVGGMLLGTLFGVFVIPVMFVLMQTLQEKISGAPAPAADAPGPAIPTPLVPLSPPALAVHLTP